MNAQFAAFEDVIVRNSDNEYWTPAIYGFYDYTYNKHLCQGVHYSQCLLYARYPSLVGTKLDVSNRDEYQQFNEGEFLKYVDSNSRLRRATFVREESHTIAIIRTEELGDLITIPYTNLRKLHTENEMQFNLVQLCPQESTSSTSNSNIDWETVAHHIAGRFANYVSCHHSNMNPQIPNVFTTEQILNDAIFDLRFNSKES